MKKAFVLMATMFLLLPAMLVAAENLGSQGLLKPTITTIGVLGRGIAISEDNPKDFKILKIGIARLKVALQGEEQELAAGVLWLEDNRYLLKNVEIGEGNASADVYLNATKVGNIDLTLVERVNTDIWVGTLSVNEENYNVYILEGQRKFKGFEFGEKISNVCRENPKECNDVAKGIGNRFCDKLNNTSCREKIKEFCEENPNDRRCVAIFRSYCEQNLEDARCRQELAKFCLENPNDEKCETFCQKFPVKCKITNPRIMEKIRSRNITKATESASESGNS